jgi:hypothetical protein
MKSFASRMLPAGVVALLLAATSFGIGIATGSTTAHTSQAHITLVKVEASKMVPPHEAGEEVAKCPAGYNVISGGYDQGAADGVLTRAQLVQHPRPGFDVKVVRLPGTPSPDAPSSLIAVAYCSKIDSAIIVGEQVPFHG